MSGFSDLKAIDLDTDDDEPLTHQQMLFVDNYCITMNQTRAMKLAGYEGDETTLAVSGSHLIRVRKVAREVAKRLNTYTMSAAEVLVRLTDVARGDMGDALTETGDISPLQLKARGKSHLIKKYRRKTYTTMDTDGNERLVTETEIELHDPLEALRILAKAQGILVNRMSIETDQWKVDAIDGIRKGELTFDSLAELFNRSVATELFISANVPIRPPGSPTTPADVEDGIYTEETTSPTTPAQPTTTPAAGQASPTTDTAVPTIASPTTTPAAAPPISTDGLPTP